jgi:hypothetical protein
MPGEPFYSAEDVEEGIRQAKLAAAYYQAQPDETDLPACIEGCIRWALAGCREEPTTCYPEGGCCHAIRP